MIDKEKVRSFIKTEIRMRFEEGQGQKEYEEKNKYFLYGYINAFWECGLISDPQFEIIKLIIDNLKPNMGIGKLNEILRGF